MAGTRITKRDIPTIDVIKPTLLNALKSGRMRGVDPLRRDVARDLCLTPQHLEFRIGKSKTTLFDNRFADALTELCGANLVERPKPGKVRLTSRGMQAVKVVAGCTEPAPEPQPTWPAETEPNLAQDVHATEPSPTPQPLADALQQAAESGSEALASLGKAANTVGQAAMGNAQQAVGDAQRAAANVVNDITGRFGKLSDQFKAGAATASNGIGSRSDAGTTTEAEGESHSAASMPPAMVTPPDAPVPPAAIASSGETAPAPVSSSTPTPPSTPTVSRAPTSPSTPVTQLATPPRPPLALVLAIASILLAIVPPLRSPGLLLGLVALGLMARDHLRARRGASTALPGGSLVSRATLGAACLGVALSCMLSAQPPTTAVSASLPATTSAATIAAAPEQQVTITLSLEGLDVENALESTGTGATKVSANTAAVNAADTPGVAAASKVSSTTNGTTQAIALARTTAPTRVSTATSVGATDVTSVTADVTGTQTAADAAGTSATAAKALPLAITGTDTTGKAVAKTVSVTPGVPSTVTLPTGIYHLRLAGADSSTDAVIYHDLEADLTLTESSSTHTVSLIARKDVEATQAREDQRKAEEEARQKAAEEEALRKQQEEEAAAEAQRQQEEAAAAAAAEAQRQQEAAAAAEAAAEAEKNEVTVYITDTGEKYHRDGCQYLKKSKHAISLDNAKARGYEPCKKCHPPQ